MRQRSVYLLISWRSDRYAQTMESASTEEGFVRIVRWLVSLKSIEELADQRSCRFVAQAGASRHYNSRGSGRSSGMPPLWYLCGKVMVISERNKQRNARQGQGILIRTGTSLDWLESTIEPSTILVRFIATAMTFKFLSLRFFLFNINVPLQSHTRSVCVSIDESLTCTCTIIFRIRGTCNIKRAAVSVIYNVIAISILWFARALTSFGLKIRTCAPSDVPQYPGLAATTTAGFAVAGPDCRARSFILRQAF